ncbi:fibronectin type III domain-containing protein, partial [Oleiagrimonas citrea]
YPPNAPPNVQVVVQGSSKITYEKAEWDAVNYADRYEVKIDSSSTIVYSGTDTMYTIESTVPPDVPVPHTPYVRACNIGGCSRWSSLPPTVPSLTVPSTNHTGSYTASWDSVSSATSYTLQEEPSGGSWSTVYSGSGTSATLSGHANGTYYYRLQACDIDGCSAWSAVQSVDVSLPPPTPSSISVPATSSGPITISWSSSSTATSYTLQAQYNGGSWNNFHTGTGTSYSYTATASGNHKFRVKACNAAGCSGYKTSGNVDVTLPPNVPTLNVPSTSETGSYSINWSSLSTATSYTLQQQANGGSWSTVYSGSGTSKSFSGMTNGTTFGYRVRACNSGGCGSWSTTKSVMVRRKPTNVTVVYDGSYKITYETAKWDALSNVSHYDVKLDSTSNGTVYSGTATSYRIASSVPPDFPPAHTAYVRA